MSKKDYRKIAEDKIKEQIDIVEVESSTVENTTEETSEPQTKKTTYAMVKCERLNVRTNPNKSANVLCVIEAGTELKVDVEGSTNEWVKVICPNSVVAGGFCMRKFMTVYEK